MEEDEHILLTQLMSIKKQHVVSMRDFVSTFNKITRRIPTADKPTTRNLKIFFISAMSSDINYDLRRSHPIDLVAIQRKFIEFVDDLISMGK